MSNENAAASQLRAFVERAERLNGEKTAINQDLSELFKEMKGEGFDTKVVKAIISDRAKDPNKKSEFDALYDLYAEALGMVVATRAPAQGHNEDGVFPDDEPRNPAPQESASDLTVLQALTGQVASQSTAARMDVPNVEADTFPADHTHPQVVRQEPGGRDAAIAGTQAPRVDTNVTTFRQPKPLRPNCLKPEMCGGQGRQHCWACTKAMNEAGAA